MQARQDKFRSAVLTKNGFAFWLALIVYVATSVFQVLADGPPTRGSPRFETTSIRFVTTSQT
jgi:hypothetical protein